MGTTCLVRTLTVALLTMALLHAPPSAAAQSPQHPSTIAPPPDSIDEAPPVTSAEVMRLFEAYALVQAQQQLQLTEDQLARFLPRFRGLLDVHRRQAQGRGRLLQQLAGVVSRPTPDEALLRDLLTKVDADEASSTVEVRKATEAVLASLTPVQQARYRIFEARLERRKLDLMTRARQRAARGARGPGARQ